MIGEAIAFPQRQGWRAYLALAPQPQAVACSAAAFMFYLAGLARSSLLDGSYLLSAKSSLVLHLVSYGVRARCQLFIK
jgi:hypothetical protein